MGNTEKKRSKYARERNPYSEIFWENVEIIMEQRRAYTSWSELSRFLGTDRTTIASMRTRRSRLTLDTVMHISDFLDVPVEKLLGRDKEILYEWNRIQLTEDEHHILIGYRSVRNHGKGDSAKRIIFTVLEEL